ncbi:DMT family transporter [Pseudomonas monteilii]
MNAFYLASAILAGSMMPLQAVVNARLARAVGGPIWAAAISALLLTLVLIIAGSAFNRCWPKLAQASGLPWWAWIGGLCGAIVLSATAAVAPRIGAANMMALVMVGQVITAMLLDRLGWFGMPIQPMSASRILAALFLIAGAALMGLNSIQR